MNIYETKNKVFSINGELWVVDESRILTSMPPKYNVYRLSDRTPAFKDCSEVNAAPTVRTMTMWELYDWLKKG